MWEGGIVMVGDLRRSLVYLLAAGTSLAAAYILFRLEMRGCMLIGLAVMGVVFLIAGLAYFYRLFGRLFRRR